MSACWKATQQFQTGWFMTGMVAVTWTARREGRPARASIFARVNAFMCEGGPRSTAAWNGTATRARGSFRRPSVRLSLSSSSHRCGELSVDCFSNPSRCSAPRMSSIRQLGLGSQVRQRRKISLYRRRRPCSHTARDGGAAVCCVGLSRAYESHAGERGAPESGAQQRGEQQAAAAAGSESSSSSSSSRQ
jgi:hypothetical protein